MNCPKCDEECICEEVDIGVGTLIGNCYCPNCGWSQKEEMTNLLNEDIKIKINKKTPWE